MPHNTNHSNYETPVITIRLFDEDSGKWSIRFMRAQRNTPSLRGNRTQRANRLIGFQEVNRGNRTMRFPQAFSWI